MSNLFMEIPSFMNEESFIEKAKMVVNIWVGVCIHVWMAIRIKAI